MVTHPSLHSAHSRAVYFGAGLGAAHETAFTPGLAALPSDSVAFGAKKSSLTEAQKLAKVHAQAMKLFTENPTNEGLIKALKKQFAGKLEIFDARQSGNEWVDKTCDLQGSVAFVHIPDSLKYNEDPRRKVEFDNGGVPFPGEYNKGALPKLYRNKKLGLFLSSSTNRNTLLHEAFHILQYMNGLPFNGDNAKVDAKAFQWDFNFNKGLTGIGALDGLFQFGRRLFAWAVEVPMILAGRAAGRTKDDPKSSGQAVRRLMHREQEVDRFLMANGRKLGLSLGDWWANASHWLMESKLKELLSYKL